MTQENKPPREFWICPETGEINFTETNTYPFRQYHVIEYSALQAAQDKIQQLELTNAKLTLHVNDIEKANDNCQTKIAELEKQNKIMRDALEFYAYKANDFTSIDEDEYHFDVDAGERARQALKDAEEL